MNSSKYRAIDLLEDMRNRNAAVEAAYSRAEKQDPAFMQELEDLLANDLTRASWAAGVLNRYYDNGLTKVEIEEDSPSQFSLIPISDLYVDQQGNKLLWGTGKSSYFCNDSQKWLDVVNKNSPESTYRTARYSMVQKQPCLRREAILATREKRERK